MPMELILKSSDVSIPQAIENIEQLKEELAPKMQYYSSLVVTEDSIKAAKADKANLNKLKKAIDEQRIAVKKQCLAIYEPLEKQCKELVGMIEAPITVIDKQIKNFDDIRKQKKYNELKAFFGEINTLEFLELEDVLNPKWGNATANTESLKEDIKQKVSNISNDFDEIILIYHSSPLLTAILDRFRETKDKGATLAYAAVLEKREQQRKEREDQEAHLIQKAAEIPETAKVTQPVEQNVEPVGTVAFKVTGTRSQIVQLRDYMKNNGISFEVIRRE